MAELKLQALKGIYWLVIVPMQYILSRLGIDPLKLRNPELQSTMWENWAGNRICSLRKSGHGLSQPARRPIYVLGISAFYHDSAAALLRDGDIIAAAQEERFTRVKNDAAFPTKSVEFCLAAAGIQLAEINAIVYYEDPLRKFWRVFITILSFAPTSEPLFLSAAPIWYSFGLKYRKALLTGLRSVAGPRGSVPVVTYSRHHYCHAASAFYASPFVDAAILSIDGVGELETLTFGIGTGEKITPIRQIRFPHSLGLFYSAITAYLGFRVNSGEYKVMGLAPYGSPRFCRKLLEQVICLQPDGGYWLNTNFFDYGRSGRAFNERLEQFFGYERRQPEGELLQHHMDVAASAQQALELVVEHLSRSIAAITRKRFLCMAGGVALNCVANSRLRRAGIFDDIWIQPAAGDAGAALGAAYVGHLALGGTLPSRGAEWDRMKWALLGPKFGSEEIGQLLSDAGAVFAEMSECNLYEFVARELADGRAVGWFSGRMEFGPRALGNRSILADPRSPAMQRILNEKIKLREAFRPFAPVVIEEDALNWFNLSAKSPYMLFTAPVREERRILTESDRLQGLDRLHIPRSQIPSVTHVDYSARVQTVNETANPRLYRLLQSFKARTGIGMLINTSFNVRGEPIVCSPLDALRCFMSTNLDLLVIENFILQKEKQGVYREQSYNKFAD